MIDCQGPSDVDHLWEPPDPKVPSERLVFPGVHVNAVQLILRFCADPLVVLPVAVVAPADIPSMEFVFVLREARLAE
eukprot:16403214-Heterocapsa_arctica.AAC.1